MGSRALVDAFWRAGVDAGYRDGGAPRPRPIHTVPGTMSAVESVLIRLVGGEALELEPTADPRAPHAPLQGLAR